MSKAGNREGIMMDRRSFLAAVPAVGLAPIIPAMATPVDPLLDAVNGYRAGIKAFAAIPVDTLTKANEREYEKATYLPHMKAIMSGEVEASSIAGVREAIRLAIEDEAIDDLLAEGALKSALAYLDGRA